MPAPMPVLVLLWGRPPGVTNSATRRSRPLCSPPVPARHPRHARPQEEQTLIDMNEPVALTFALRYLVNFTKATSLSPSVVRRGCLMGPWPWGCGGRRTRRATAQPAPRAPP